MITVTLSEFISCTFTYMYVNVQEMNSESVTVKQGRAASHFKGQLQVSTSVIINWNVITVYTSQNVAEPIGLFLNYMDTFLYRGYTEIVYELILLDSQLTSMT